MVPDPIARWEHTESGAPDQREHRPLLSKSHALVSCSFETNPPSPAPAVVKVLGRGIALVRTSNLDNISPAIGGRSWPDCLWGTGESELRDTGYPLRLVGLVDSSLLTRFSGRPLVSISRRPVAVKVLYSTLHTYYSHFIFLITPHAWVLFTWDSFF